MRRVHVLCVGIDSYPTMPLHQCVNDMERMRKLFHDIYHVPEKQIAFLKNEDATTENMKLAFRRVIEKCKSGDHAIISYSGHGAQVAVSKKEEDGIEESLCPVNFAFEDPTTWFLDDLLCSILHSAEDDVLVTLILDCCFAAGQSRDIATQKTARRIAAFPGSLMHTRVHQMRRKGTRVFRIGKHMGKKDRQKFLTLSACAEDETAAEISGGGMFTIALCNVLRRVPTCTVAVAMKRVLETVHGQTPQIDGPVCMKKDPII